MSFARFKKEVMKLATKQNVAHFVPGDNDLFILYEKKMPAKAVVKLHCTYVAVKKRHGVEVSC